MRPRIIFNGQEYASPDDMPPQVRQAYEQMLQTFADRNQDGIPDFLQQGMSASPGQIDLSFGAIEFNGQTYNSLEEMPPEARQAYEKAMQALNSLGGLAGVLGDGAERPAQPGAPPPAAAARPPASLGAARPYAPPPGSQPVLSGDVESSTRTLRWLLIGGAAVILVLLAVIAGLVALYVIPNFF